MSNQTIENVTSGADRAKVILAIAAVVAGLIGFYWLAQQPTIARVGAVLAGLAVGGQIQGEALHAGLAWLPFMAAGALAAQPLRHSIDAVRFRHGVLALATLSALAVIVRVVLA